jgi:hypothetical protein
VQGALIDVGRHINCSSKARGATAPSVCIWEYCGVTRAEWVAEVGSGALTKRNVRRLLAFGRR